MTNNTRRSSSIPIFMGKIIIGRVRHGVFFKRIKGSKHFLEEPPAIAFSEMSLGDALRAGAQELEVTDTETRRIYRADLAHFKQHCFEVHRAGFERQWAMRLEQWSVKGERKRKRSVATKPPLPSPVELHMPVKKTEPAQLELFRRSDHH